MGVSFSSEKGQARACEEPHGLAHSPPSPPTRPRSETCSPETEEPPAWTQCPHPIPFPESDDVELEKGLQGDLETSLLGKIRGLRDKGAPSKEVEHCEQSQRQEQEGVWDDPQSSVPSRTSRSKAADAVLMVATNPLCPAPCKLL